MDDKFTIKGQWLRRTKMIGLTRLGLTIWNSPDGEAYEIGSVMVLHCHKVWL